MAKNFQIETKTRKPGILKVQGVYTHWQMKLKQYQKEHEVSVPFQTAEVRVKPSSSKEVGGAITN